MSEETVRRLLSESGRRALETMFFTTPDVVSNGGQRPTGDLISASLACRGSPPGRFSAVLAAPVARTITANFLGVEDGAGLPLAQLQDGAGELANIICGAVLSELDSNGSFDISAPVTAYLGPADPGPDDSNGPPVTVRFEL